MIEIKGLVKRFGKLEVLKELEASIQKNKITAIVGHNGSGKTTLIKCLLGLDKYDAGSISIDDYQLNGDWSYRNQIGYMPQVARFPDNLTASEVITMISDLRSGFCPCPLLLFFRTKEKTNTRTIPDKKHKKSLSSFFFTVPETPKKSFSYHLYYFYNRNWLNTFFGERIHPGFSRRNPSPPGHS